MISVKKDVRVILDKLAKNLSDSIDTQMLYTALGWTIVRAPSSFFVGSSKTILNWMDSHCGEHHYWDGQIAFKEGKDATMFLLRWS